MKAYKVIAIALGILALGMVLGSFQVETALSSRTQTRGTDSIVGYDAYNGYTASSSAATITAPKSGYGNLYYSSDQYDQYKVAVVAGDEVTFHFVRSASTSYIDLYFYNNAKTQVYLANNVKDFTYTVTATGSGYAYFAVDADSSVDTGNYYLEVTKTGSGGGGTEDGGLLTDGVAASGHMNSADGSDMYWIDVGANAESMYVVLTCGSADFDTYGRFNAQPTTSTYDWRGYTSGGEENTVTSPAQGRHYIMVQYYSGDADYQLTATITYGTPADTTAPSVSISAPSNGATVTGTVTISFTASDANGIASRAIKIDGTTVSTSSSYSWNTAAYSDGSHTIQCTATDPSGNTGSDSHTVTVNNPVADTTAPSVSISSPSSGATVSDTVTISFTASDANGISSRAIKIDGTTVSTSSSYSWNTAAYSDGSHTIQCTATDPSGNTGSDTHTVTVDNAPVVDDGGVLTNGVAASGHMSSADGSDMYWISVGANAESMRVVLTQSSGDFDTYGRFGAQPTTSTYDWRGYTSGGEDNTVSNPAQGTHYIMVDYYSGDADYQLTATITYAAADTTAPTVTISSPSGTVSGTVTISFTASDANGISSRAIKIDGVTKSTSSSYSWDTTAYSNGGHTIVCTATDPSGNTGTASRSVTVDNSAPADDGGALSDGSAASGHMNEADGADMWYIDIDANAISMYVVLTCGSADFDTYGRAGAEPTTSTYDWRGYTSGGEENTVANPAEGRYYIMVDWYSGDADYQLTATITYGGGSGGWGTGGKYAIIVGISDYASISDLSYCDEDATDWYNFLNGQGYECHVYGDGHTSNYPRYDGTAYEATVRAAIVELANHAQAGDEVLFVTSGHGAGDGNGNSYLCMYDCSGSAGCYYDTEIAADFSGFGLDVNIMIFIDHCYSGGIGPELMNLSQKIYCTTTCTEDGYGYDEPTYQNGAWTYEYLQKYWVGSPTSSAESIYDLASASYPHSGGDACMEFDGFPGSFYI